MNTLHKTRILTLSLLSLGCSAFAEEEAKLPEIKVDTTPLPASAPTFAPIVDKVASAVVTISTSKNVRLRDNPYFNDPFFRRFFNIPDDEENTQPKSPRRGNDKGADKGSGKKQKQMMGLGSGVIVSAEGHILTNNHVVDGADDIVVTIGLAKHGYKARKIGTDPGSDLAVLKIDGATVQPITFTDSDKVRVGDTVLAVGNPFGLTRSVSAGIVSSLGRSNLQMAQYENYIQTDASINPGNSGGALVDYEGRLIGINTSIFSRSGGNEGIGFAVPSNLARNVMESILKHGHVVRGFLGIGLQEVTEDLAKAFKITDDSGALVNEVQPKSPAEKVGIQAGDIVTDINGKKVDGPKELQLAIGSMTPGAKVDVKVLRDGKEKAFNVVLAERPNLGIAGAIERPKAEQDPDVLDGVTVSDIDADARKEFNIPADTKGVVITKVEEESASAAAGIKPGDVVAEINREPVTSAKQAVEMSEKLKKEKKVLLRVMTKGTSRYVVVEHKE